MAQLSIICSFSIQMKQILFCTTVYKISKWRKQCTEPSCALDKLNKSLGPPCSVGRKSLAPKNTLTAAGILLAALLCPLALC